MAASMLRRRLCGPAQLLRLTAVRKATTASGYYVVLPEIPPDTAETNPIMCLESPTDFNNITPDNVVTGCAKSAIVYDVELGKHLDVLGDPGMKKNFATVMEPLETIHVPMNQAWKTAQHLSYVKKNTYGKAYQRVHPQVEKAKMERWNSVPFYNAIKEVAADHSNLSEAQQRLVARYLKEAQLNGVDFTGSELAKFKQTLAALTNAKNTFRNRVTMSHNLFAERIEDFSLISEMPPTLASELSLNRLNPSRGPWNVTLDIQSYQPFMEYCGNRMTRWNVWSAYNNRGAPRHDNQNLSNHNIIKEIRTHRKDIAEMLGYESHAQMCLDGRMASSVENVLNTIENLKLKLKKVNEENVKSLEEFAQSQGFTQQGLEMWDLPYWRRRQKEHLYPVDDVEVSEFFPYPTVLKSAFNIMENLFSISVHECTAGDVPVWHKDVTVYKIYNQNDSAKDKVLAVLYIDAYRRPGEKIAGSWVDTGADRSYTTATTPVVYLNLNLHAPFGGRPSMMSHRNLLHLFYHLGSVLQQSLTTVSYSELSGQHNIELDAASICSQVMQMLLNTPENLIALSSHVDTGEKVSESMVQAVLKAQNHLSSVERLQELYCSAFDLEMYVSMDHWYQVRKRLWYEFMCLPLNEEDNHPCSMVSTFSGQNAPNHYSQKWSEMIAADIVESFSEAHKDGPDKVKHVGQRFRDTFLSLGGSVATGEVFRRFCGRDPSQDALIKRYCRES